MQAEVARLPFGDGVFDAAVICLVLEHVLEFIEAIEETSFYSETRALAQFYGNGTESGHMVWAVLQNLALAAHKTETEVW